MIFFTAAALIGLDTLGAFSANGAQALTWLFFSAITFLVPYGLLTAALGSTLEGSQENTSKMGQNEVRRDLLVSQAKEKPDVNHSQRSCTIRALRIQSD